MFCYNISKRGAMPFFIVRLRLTQDFILCYPNLVSDFYNNLEPGGTRS